MSQSLGEFDQRLRGINLILGEWAHASIFSSNVYSIGSKCITLVDAGEGNEYDSFTSAFQRFNLKLNNIAQVVITHSHDDHWKGLLDLLKKIPLDIMVYKEDIGFYQRELRCMEGVNMYRIIGLEDGDVVKAEGHTINVLHTPGHDDGGLCLYDQDCKILFSGDTVFPTGTTGSLRSGNIDDMKRSLKRLATLDIDIMLPGHGKILLKSADEVIRLALSRITWFDCIPDDAPYWMRLASIIQNNWRSM